MDSQYLSENDIDCIKSLFNKYDSNQNGSLEKEELVNSFLEIFKLMDEKKKPDEIENIAKGGIEKFDFNHNGTLEYNEFVELVAFLVLEKGLSFDYYYY